MALQGCTSKPRAKIVDRADGVKGHFAIGLCIIALGGSFWKFWNEKTAKWESAGTVYITEQEAEKKLRELGQLKKGTARDI